VPIVIAAARGAPAIRIGSVERAVQRDLVAFGHGRSARRRRRQKKVRKKDCRRKRDRQAEHDLDELAKASRGFAEGECQARQS
jgi:hypothetical protein